jgi:probable rRNA maturation factor
MKIEVYKNNYNLKFDFFTFWQILEKNLLLMGEKKILKNLTVNLILVNKEEIKNLNYLYRGKKKETDVLSFPYYTDDYFNTNIFGEIFLCVPQMKEQASFLNHSLNEELSILIIHSILHLLGYDHIKKKDYVIMHKKELFLREKIKKIFF